MAIVEQTEWAGHATNDQMRYLIVLDQDVQSVQLEFDAFHEIVASSKKLDSGGIARAAHHAKSFVCAVRRVVRLLEVMQPSRHFAAASRRLKRNLRNNAALFADFTRVRNAIEHANAELTIFPDVAPLIVYSSRVVLPIGVIARVDSAALHAVLSIRSGLIEDLKGAFARLGADPLAVPRRHARVVCLSCGSRYDLPFVMGPNHDTDEMCRIWVETPCPQCHQTPSAHGVGGVGGPLLEPAG